jgi:hypothetical protein
LYCFEPFYTFYVGRNLGVKPCCNALAPTNLGQVGESAALDIWHGKGFDETRRRILANQYPRMCHSCVEAGNAQAENHFVETIAEYGVWFTKVFGCDFDCTPLNNMISLGQSPEVATRWRRASSGSGRCQT